MKWLLLLLLSFSSSVITHQPAQKFLIVWNVGQGQWVTAVTAQECWHFDMGGEFFPWQKIQAQCALRKNKVLLSHWDWDHIGALDHRTSLRRLRGLCLLLPPMGSSSARKQAVLKAWPRCRDDNFQKIKLWKPQSGKSSNDLSQVIGFKDHLIPGDSTEAQEKTWRLLPWVQKTRIMVLGHHGSRTSTSEELLNKLPRLKMGVSSARWRRHRHPHSEVELRVRKARVALLRTEDWGNIWFEE